MELLFPSPLYGLRTIFVELLVNIVEVLNYLKPLRIPA